MFDTEAYLDRLGYAGSLAATPETLRALHKRHLVSIPYDNSKFSTDGTLPDNLADVDIDATFKKIVLSGVGGICFELNPLFNRLLRELGFDTMTISAGVRQEGGVFSPDLSHMFTGARLGDELWLADVGFSGPSFLEPLRMTGEVQHQYGCQYKVVEQEGWQTLYRKSRTSEWRAIYRFMVTDRRIEDWQGFTRKLREFTAGSVLAHATIRARSSESGHMLLVGKRYLTVEDGYEKVTALVDSTDFEETVDRILSRNA